MSSARPCALYRHFDRAGTLLYVGIAVNPERRWRAHRQQSLWVRRRKGRRTVDRRAAYLRLWSNAGQPAPHDEQVLTQIAVAFALDDRGGAA